jgi:hypothetical protein
MGVVVAVREDGRRLEVRAEGGEVVEFVLSPATARFVAAGRAHGLRLELFDDHAQSMFMSAGIYGELQSEATPKP